MTSTFKLTRAEFKKIFKRPSIFVMAIMLVLTIFISIYIFKPSEKTDNTIVYTEVSTSNEYYDYFNNELNPNSKASFDLVFNNTDKFIKYYDSLNNNTNLLNNYYTELISSMNLMIAENNTTLKDNLRKDVLSNANNFLNAYKSLDSLKDYNDIIDYTTKDYTYIIKDGYNLVNSSRNYYKSTGCKKLQDFINYLSNTSQYPSNEVVNYYINNNYEQELNKVLNNGINFIYTTMKGFVSDYDTFYIEYLKTSGVQELPTMKAMRANLLKVLTSFDDYLELLINNDFPIVIIEKEVYLDINRKVDDAIANLTPQNISSDSNIEFHTQVKNYLESSKLLTAINNIIGDNVNSSKIKQVKLSIEKINELTTIQSKVNSNKIAVLDEIKTHIHEESISNIAKSITDYSLLSKSYNEIILDKVLLNITDIYDSLDYSKFYGYKFNEFNKYQVNEKITTNAYYINNNIYANSFNSNFAYNQNSSQKTNLYDYMYFTLELCSIIIIIFAMMLVCSLITGETESGTIKLLLVRPFKRAKIITAKLLATIFFVITFMLFSGIITYIGGYFLYGDVTTSILAVFNSTTAFEISPFLLMIINILTLTFDIIFFISIALMISILCKNYAASITCALVILFVNYAFNILFSGNFWYSILPGMNLHLFKFFGNSFIATSGTGLASLIKSLLITGIQSSMTFWYSFCISFAYLVVSLSISYTVFQNRDF